MGFGWALVLANDFPPFFAVLSEIFGSSPVSRPVSRVRQETFDSNS